MGLALAEAGADVAIIELDIPAAEETAAEIRKRGRKALSIKADVTLLEEVAVMVDTVLQEWRRLDILVNNAGYAQPISALDMSVQDWDRLLAVDLRGVFLCSKTAATIMMPVRIRRLASLTALMLSIFSR